MSLTMPEMIPTIDVVALHEMFERGDTIVLLDVRENFERALCSIAEPDHVVGIHIPLNQIPGRVDELRDLAENRPVVVYCHHGVRSDAAATWLARQGLSDVLNLEGGIDAWSLRVDPKTPRY